MILVVSNPPHKNASAQKPFVKGAKIVRSMGFFLGVGAGVIPHKSHVQSLVTQW